MRSRGASGDAGGPRFGFTITKKIGNAVVRNRIRRRLKAAFASTAAQEARQGCDYVIVARLAALERPYPQLLDDVARALKSLHDPVTDRRNPASKARPTVDKVKKSRT